MLKSADREGCGRRGRKRERGGGESKKKVYQRHTKKEKQSLEQTDKDEKEVGRASPEGAYTVLTTIINLIMD